MGITTAVWNCPSAWATAEPTTVGAEPVPSPADLWNTILTFVPGLKPFPLRWTTWPDFALAGAETEGLVTVSLGAGAAYRWAGGTVVTGGTFAVVLVVVVVVVVVAAAAVVLTGADELVVVDLVLAAMVVVLTAVDELPEDEVVVAGMVVDEEAVVVDVLATAGFELVGGPDDDVVVADEVLVAEPGTVLVLVLVLLPVPVPVPVLVLVLGATLPCVPVVVVTRDVEVLGAWPVVLATVEVVLDVEAGTVEVVVVAEVSPGTEDVVTVVVVDDRAVEVVVVPTLVVLVAEVGTVGSVVDVAPVVLVVADAWAGPPGVVSAPAAGGRKAAALNRQSSPKVPMPNATTGVAGLPLVRLRDGISTHVSWIDARRACPWPYPVAHGASSARRSVRVATPARAK